MIKYIDCNINDFVNQQDVNVIYCFGASPVLDRIERNKIISDFLRDKQLRIVDSNPNKQRTQINFLGEKRVIYSPEIMKKNDGEILITAGLRHYESIINQLDEMDLSMKCYYASLILSYGGYSDSYELEDVVETLHTEKIPRIIHSCWFSGESKPYSYQKCIDSWKKYCPDYEIIEWNSNNYDVCKNQYMKQAYEKRKWAFVSDYARLDVVNEYGGIYLDMDVELIDNIDKMLGFDAFFAMDTSDRIDLGSGFGAIKGHKLVKQIVEQYNDMQFIKENGELDMLPQPERFMNIFVNRGVNKLGKSQIIDNMAILSNEYFASVHGGEDDRIWTGRELAIHWHNAAWLSEEEQNIRQTGIGYKSEIRKRFKRL